MTMDWTVVVEMMTASHKYLLPLEDVDRVTTWIKANELARGVTWVAPGTGANELARWIEITMTVRSPSEWDAVSTALSIIRGGLQDVGIADGLRLWRTEVEEAEDVPTVDKVQETA